MAEDAASRDPRFLGLLVLGWDVAVFIFKPIGRTIANVVYYLAFSLLFLFKLLWRPLEFLLLPLLYLGQFALRCMVATFHFLAKFETLYIYLGIAAVIGLSGGIAISLVSGGLQTLLGLNSNSNSTPQGRTIKDYRKAKRKQDRLSDVPSSPPTWNPPQPISVRSGGKRKSRAGKVGKPPTILEELDSDY